MGFGLGLVGEMMEVGIVRYVPVPQIPTQDGLICVCVSSWIESLYKGFYLYLSFANGGNGDLFVS